MDEAEKRRETNPRQAASPLSVLTFAWLFKTFLTGFRRELDLSDLYYPLDEHSSHNVGERISAEWKREQERCKDLNKSTSPNLIRVLARCFGRDIMVAGFFQAVLEFFIRLSRPYILLQLLHYSSERSGIAKIEPYGWAAALVAGVFIDCVTTHVCVQNLMHIGMKIRVACCSLLYRKILNVPVTFTETETSVGQVLNLLSNDVSRLDHAVYYMHYIWMAPLEALLVFYFLYREVGLAASSGICLQLLFIPILGLFGRLTNRLTSKYTVRTDERLRLTNEIIKGIRAIKMYAWEKPFSLLVDHARKEEVQIIKLDSINTDMSLASEFYIPRLSIFITVLAYVLLGNNVNAEKVYVVTALYDVLRISMYTLFPMCLHDVAEALVSVKRLQKFMLIEEISSLPPTSNHVDKAETNAPESAISFKNVSLQWTPKVKVLENINLDIQRKSLTAIVGQVGSGKTSLLQAILRELPCTNEGEIKIQGGISYAAQEPWIFASTVRQNILFGRPLDETRYERVIDVCQLRRDLDIFPLGDATMVGEKGINLSGGQCARLNLARAIYRDTDIYLLDDPLSAVDAVVGRNIFQECIKTYLREKTVILITHQFQYLEEVDRLIVLNNGTIEADGTFAELQSSGLNLLQVMQISNQFDEAKESQKVQANSVQDGVVTQNVAEHGDKFVEEKLGGSISGRTYLSYFLASRNVPLVVLVFFASFLHQLAASGGDYFLAFWVNSEENATKLQTNATCNEHVCTHRDWYIYFYSGITISTIFMCFLQSWTFFEMSMRIANNLHSNMFISVISATIDFFSTNPLGRIMNRFSKDMSIVDTEVSRAMIDVIQNAIHIIAAFVVVTSVNPWLIIPAVFVGFFFYFFSLFFIKTSRSIKRLEAITRSPVFNHVSDSLQGLTTIRALRAKEILIDEFDDHQDLHSSACFIFFSGSRGLGMYLDLFCALFLTCVLFTLMSLEKTTLAGDIGLAITQCMMLLNTLQWGVRQFAELENQMTSVERVLEYSTLPGEPYESTDESRKKLQVEKIFETTPLTDNKIENELTRLNWPSEGRIDFRMVYLKYDKEGVAVLRNLNFVINAGEKIGIVGRTGAGKSSLLNALFRMAYVEGNILIDDVPTNTIGLRELRSKISIIPQEPILFTGNLRKNLDPFNEYSDNQLWQALEDVGMRAGLDVSAGLSARVAEGGSNFSVGQRQLLCLARAIVRKNRILVLDEATANVDPTTDDLIQKTVKKKFENCTILTIAHRLNTVIDNDRIMVMDSGSIVEFDHPYILLTEKKGSLHNIVQQSGAGAAQLLLKMAKLSYDMKIKST